MKDGRFCSTQCVGEWRTDKSWTTSKCLHCGNDFKHRKKERNHRSGNPRMFCSNECNRSSDHKKEKLRKWGLSDANPRKDPKVIEKISGKLKGRNIGFGSPGKKSNHSIGDKKKMARIKKKQYKNNKEEILAKRDETYLKKYGMTCGKYYALIGRKAVTRISKGQRDCYKKYKKQYPDAILEHWLKDINKFADIFIPSQNLIVEYNGDYWHCNPDKYDPDYVHPSRHLTAEAIWEKDAERERQLKKAGYNVTVEWEN